MQPPALRRRQPGAKTGAKDGTRRSFGQPTDDAEGTGPLTALSITGGFCALQRQQQLLLQPVLLLLLVLVPLPPPAAADAAIFRNVTVAAPQDGAPWFECGFYTLSYKVGCMGRRVGQGYGRGLRRR